MTVELDCFSGIVYLTRKARLLQAFFDCTHSTKLKGF
jgi:hypothetical protein